MTTPKESTPLQWGKLLVPVVVLLVGGQGWQFYKTPDKIKEVTHETIDNVMLSKLDYKIDSIAKTLVSKEYAKNALNNAVSEIKQLDGLEAKRYLSKVFAVADEAIKNDSIWRNVQRPYIDQMTNKRFLCPVLDLKTNKVYFQGIEGDYQLREDKHDVNGGYELSNKIFFYFDKDNQVTPVYSLRRPIYKR